MSNYESMNHSKWDCKYHVVFVPKGRKKELYGKIWKFLGPVFRELAQQRGSTIWEGHMVQDDWHLLGVLTAAKLPALRGRYDLAAQLK